MIQYLVALMLPASSASGSVSAARLAVGPVGFLRLTTGGGQVGECPSH